MSFFEIITIFFISTFLLQDKDINKLKKLLKKLKKHIQNAKNLQTKANNFLTKTFDLSTNKKPKHIKTISFVENDFELNQINPDKIKVKLGKKKLSTKQTKQTK